MCNSIFNYVHIYQNLNKAIQHAVESKFKVDGDWLSNVNISLVPIIILIKHV